MIEVKSKITGEVLAIFDTINKDNLGLTFHGSTDDRIQVIRMQYNEGQILRKRKGVKHSIPSDDVHTQKTLLVYRGQLLADIYDYDNLLLHTSLLKSGEFLICLQGGHGFKIREDNTVIFEVKTGPFLGDDKDRMWLD